MAYARKTVDEYQLWADYGYGKEVIVTYDDRSEALEDLKAYRAEEGNIGRFWVVKHRVKRS